MEFIKEVIGTQQLVSVGNEGTITCCSNVPDAMDEVDYVTFHAWAQNWGWYHPSKGDFPGSPSFNNGKNQAKSYIEKNVS